MKKVLIVLFVAVMVLMFPSSANKKLFVNDEVAIVQPITMLAQTISEEKAIVAMDKFEEDIGLAICEKESQTAITGSSPTKLLCEMGRAAPGESFGYCHETISRPDKALALEQFGRAAPGDMYTYRINQYC